MKINSFSLWAKVLIAILITGCVENVPVSTDDKDAPEAALLGVSQYSEPVSLNSQSTPTVMKVGELETVQLLASGSDKGGVRSVTLTAVSGGMLRDDRGNLVPNITVEKDTVNGKAVDLILFPAQAVFDSPNTDMILRTSSLDWAGNTQNSAALTLKQQKMPVARISASSQIINHGQSVTINYETENADVVKLNGQILTTKTGTKVFSPTQQTTYDLEAQNSFGKTMVSTTVIVNAPVNAPVISEFKASSYTVTVGTSVTLSWRCTNCTSIRIDPIGHTSSDRNSSTTTTLSVQGVQNFTLTATGPGGTSTKSLSITVNPQASTERCFTTGIGTITSFSKTGQTTNGNVHYSEWIMDLANWVQGQGTITTIKNENSFGIRLFVGNSYLDMYAGQATDLFEGFPTRNVYRAAVTILGNQSPAAVKIKVCYQP